MTAQSGGKHIRAYSEEASAKRLSPRHQPRSDRLAQLSIPLRHFLALLSPALLSDLGVRQSVAREPQSLSVNTGLLRIKPRPRPDSEKTLSCCRTRILTILTMNANLEEAANIATEYLSSKTLRLFVFPSLCLAAWRWMAHELFHDRRSVVIRHNRSPPAAPAPRERLSISICAPPAIREIRRVVLSRAAHWSPFFPLQVSKTCPTRHSISWPRLSTATQSHKACARFHVVDTRCTFATVG